MRYCVRVIPVLVIFSFLFSLLGTGGAVLADEPQMVIQTIPDRFIVHFKSDVSPETVQQIHQQMGATVEKDISQIGAQVIVLPQVRAADLAASYTDFSEVEFIEPDYLATTSDLPNDSEFSQQWGLTKIQAPDAWQLTRGSSNIKIAILDTGIDSKHPDLAGKIVARKNFSDSDTAEDLHKHGTHVAGIAAAATDNKTGIAGMGYNSSLMNVKVLNDNGGGTYSAITQGIIWAADNGANVINLSLGGGGGSSTMRQAVDYAWKKGAVVVAAAGNSGKSSPSYPAYYDNAIAVAATDTSDRLFSFSNYGDWVDVAAPGSSLSTLPGNKYGTLSGTSMASPFVAGLAALLMSVVEDSNADGNLNDEVRDLIQSTSDDPGISGIGYGRINAYKAVKGALSAPAPAPAPSPTPGPIRATFGLNTGNATLAGTSMMNAQRFRNTAGTGNLTRLEVLVNDPAPRGKIRLGVYADNNGVPGNLLLDAGEVNVVNGWTGIGGLSLPVTANTPYWLTFLPQTGTAIRYQTTGMPANSHAFQRVPYGALPAGYGVGQINSTPYVMRATVSSAAQPAPAPIPVRQTFGLDRGDFSYSKAANYLDVMRFRNTAGTGSLTGLQVLIDDPAPSGKIRLGVYADNNGLPGSLLLDAGEVDAASGWVSIPGLNLPVTQGAYYWLGYSQSARNDIRGKTYQEAGSHYYVQLGRYGSLPAAYPLTGAAANNNQYVMRAIVAVNP